MCGVEVMSLNSRNCTYYQTNPHVWKKYTYILCSKAATRGRHCDNAQPVDGQAYEDIGSAREIGCPVCSKLSAAIYQRDEAKRLADEIYAIAEEAAYRDEKYYYPPPSPPESNGGRDSRDRRRDDRHDSHKHRRGERKEKNQDYDDQRRHEGGRRNYSK